MEINSCVKREYENLDIWWIGKKKANSKPIQTQTKPIKANSNPIKANFAIPLPGGRMYFIIKFTQLLLCVKQKLYKKQLFW